MLNKFARNLKFECKYNLIMRHKNVKLNINKKTLILLHFFSRVLYVNSINCCFFF